jgi:hypothetical protein
MALKNMRKSLDERKKRGKTGTSKNKEGSGD